MGQQLPIRTRVRQGGALSTPRRGSAARPVGQACAPRPASRDDWMVMLADLQAQFDTLKAQVRQAQQLSSLGTAAAMIAHEVNNLLTPIVAYAKAALEGDDVELQKKALTVTAKNAEILMAMSQRILSISAAAPTQRKSVNLRIVVEEAAASLCRDFSKDGISFSVNVDKSITVFVDALQIQQVFFNLFLNAREAMASTHTGRLSVSARRQAGQVVIEVRNTGEGIPPDWLPSIFEPFQTAKSETNNNRSRCRGLGLTLCRDLIEENDGTIHVASEPATGTTFTIAIPSSPSGDASASGLRS